MQVETVAVTEMAWKERMDDESETVRERRTKRGVWRWRGGCGRVGAGLRPLWSHLSSESTSTRSKSIFICFNNTLVRVYMYLSHRIELDSDSRPTSNLNLETTHQLHNPGE